MHRPATLEELRAVVSRAPKIRVVGSGHSFNAIADAPELVSLERMPGEIVVDGATVSAPGAARYGDLVPVLAAEGVALANLASLPHISVAGAVATGTHGSGERNGNLATAVAALELVTSEGEVVTLRRGDADFDGAVVALGALGAVTRITLDVEPEYRGRPARVRGPRVGGAVRALRRHRRERLQRQRLHRLGRPCRRCVGQAPRRPRPRATELFGARAAVAEHHPIAGLDPVHCTPQLGVPGPWAERLPHFRMGFTPSVGHEIQSEYFVPRAPRGRRPPGASGRARRRASAPAGQRDPDRSPPTRSG